MKKRFRTITALVMIAFMALSSSAVFADDLPGFERVDGEPAASQQADQDMGAMVEEEALPSVQEAVPAEKGEIAAKDGENWPAKKLTYNTTAKPGWETVSVSKSALWKWNGIKAECSGMMYLDVKANSNNPTSTYVYVGTWDGSKVNYDSVYGRTILQAGNSNTIGPVPVTAGKTYCIATQPSYEVSSKGSVQFRAYVYAGYDRTLPVSSNWMLSPGWSPLKSQASTIRYKIKPSKTGYINVYLKEFGKSYTNGYVTLLNSNKKVISDELNYWQSDSSSDKVVFGVKKGVTYYLKVTNCGGVLANHYCYGIKYSIKGGKVGKSSKSKATKLKRKGSYKAKILLADNKSGNQWFKFKVTKKRKTQINIDATNIESGEVTAVFYRGKEKISTWTVWNGQVNPFSSVGKLPKGTYYVKITKSKKASGQYRIKYVK